MKKIIFAVMASVVIATLVFLVGGGCGKNEQESEVAMIVSDITDSTAYVTCDYHPVKSVSYQLFVCKAVSGEYNKSTRFKISGLRCGSRYEVVVISYNSKHEQVGSTVLNFVTTGVPENMEERKGPYHSDEDSAVIIVNDPVPGDGKDD